MTRIESGVPTPEEMGTEGRDKKTSTETLDGQEGKAEKENIRVVEITKDDKLEGTEESILDVKGRVTEIRKKGPDGLLKGVVKIDYDDKGRKIKEIEENLNSSGKKNGREMQVFVYHENGVLKSVTSEATNEYQPKRETNKQYDERGLLVSESYATFSQDEMYGGYKSPDTSSADYKYELDEKTGQPVRAEGNIFADGRLIGKEETKYIYYPDKPGDRQEISARVTESGEWSRRSKTVKFIVDNKPVLTHTEADSFHKGGNWQKDNYITKNSYDEAGNLLQEENHRIHEDHLLVGGEVQTNRTDTTRKFRTL